MDGHHPLSDRSARDGVLVVAPTRRELGGVARRGGPLATSGRTRADRGRLSAVDGRASVVGIGQVAGERTAAMLDTEPKALLVSLGLAGGLDPSLRPGELIVASGYRHGDDETVGDVDVAARVSLLLVCLGLPATAGVVVTSDEPLPTPDSKRRARADSDGLVVDMEGFWLARAAQVRGVPHIGLHCVVDEAGLALPDFVSRVAADSHRREWIHALGALRSVGAARHLSNLARRARIAGWVLREAAWAVLDAVADGALPGGARVKPNSPSTSTMPLPEDR